MSLIVCPLHQVPLMLETHAPSHILTLLAPGLRPPGSGGIAPDRHLKLSMNDITAPMPGLVTPHMNHIEAILHFAAGWDRKAPMLIHCSAGISRSTAAAYIVACLHAGAGHEEALAQSLRALAPSATPNRLMVTLADDLLHRQGRMSDAITKSAAARKLTKACLSNFPSAARAPYTPSAATSSLLGNLIVAVVPIPTTLSIFNSPPSKSI